MPKSPQPERLADSCSPVHDPCGSVQLCVTGPIFAEYEEVLRRPRLQRSEETIRGVLEAVRTKGLWVRAGDPVRVCSDPDDDIFLQCSHAAHADYLVTGNVRHFPTSWGGTQVVTARWLLDRIRDPGSAGAV